MLTCCGVNVCLLKNVKKQKTLTCSGIGILLRLISASATL